MNILFYIGIVTCLRNRLPEGIYRVGQPQPITVAQLLNNQSPTFKKMGIKADQLDDQQALELMMENPA